VIARLLSRFRGPREVEIATVLAYVETSGTFSLKRVAEAVDPSVRVEFKAVLREVAKRLRARGDEFLAAGVSAIWRGL
jgi:hypothetical protein